MTIRDFSKIITTQLQPLYDSHEAAAIAKLYLEERLQMPAYELALHAQDSLSSEQEVLFSSDLTSLQQGCPIQYVLGTADFHSHSFKVTPDVLIPRPETEELVDRIVCKHRNDGTINIWDIGTGSGCIAVSLALALPNAQIYASDISKKALAVAQENAKQLHAHVHFSQHDMLQTHSLPFSAKFDIIVSNPPYIPQSERPNMHRNVVDYEPGSALFVPNHDPLLFYRAIGEIGRTALTDKGIVYAETFEDFHQESARLFQELGYGDFQSIEDINGRKRIIQVSK